MTQETAPSPAARVAGRVALVLIALLAFVMSLRTITNSDAWMHLSIGRQVAKHGIPHTESFSFAVADDTPWRPATWLYDWTLYRLWHLGGPRLVVVSHGLAAALAFALMLAAARARPAAALAAGLLALHLAAPQLVIRPTLPALLFTALLFWLLSRPRSLTVLLILAVPLQVAWANIHLSFLIGPALALAAALSHLWAERRDGHGGRSPGRDRLVLAGALLLASLANPYGPHIHLQSATAFLQPGKGEIAEWISPFAPLFDAGWRRHLPTGVLLAIALGFILHRQRLPWLGSVLGVAGAFLLVWTPVQVEWCALLALPALTLSVQAVLQVIAQFAPSASRFAGPAIAALAVGAGLLSAGRFTRSDYYRDAGSAARFGWSAQTDLYPFDVARGPLSSPRFPPRLYNMPLDGGALLWAQPARPVLVDARAGVYEPELLRNLHAGLRGDRERWAELTRQWPADALLFNCCWSGSGSMIRNLLLSGEWSLAYFDGNSALLMPALRRNLPWLRNTSLQQAGLGLLENARRDYVAALNRGERPPNPPRLIGAASFLQSIGRFREAGALYSLLARGSPEMTGAWLNLGICLVQQGNPTTAIPILEYTRHRLPKHVMAHLWLSRAYRETGRPDLAERAYQRAFNLDRPVAETFAGLADTNLPTTTQGSAPSR